MAEPLVEIILLGMAGLGGLLALAAAVLGFPRAVREASRRAPEIAASIEPQPEAPRAEPVVAAPIEAPLEPPARVEPAQRALEVDRGAVFRRSLRNTRAALVGRLAQLLRGASSLDAPTLERIEELLFGADLGVRTADRLLESARESGSPDRVRGALERRALEILNAVGREQRAPAGVPRVVLVVGVNGSGKTTTIGKLAAHRREAGERVLLAAGDTFRAAAIEQLEIWAERVGVELVKGKPGGDPASVAFDAIQAGRSRGSDSVIIDTAGRLQTDAGLMDELRKIARVVKKEIPDAPHEVLLVLDANTGQNAIRQAHEFAAAVDVTGIVLTKLDGTAKGGVVLGIAEEVGIPVRWVGIGEGAGDLREFDAELFVRALFADEREGEDGGEELRAGA